MTVGTVIRGSTDAGAASILVYMYQRAMWLAFPRLVRREQRALDGTSVDVCMPFRPEPTSLRDRAATS